MPMRRPASRNARDHATDNNGSGATTRRDRTRSNERILAIYSPADRHFAARRRGDAGWIPGLLVAADIGLAAGRFPDHPGPHPPPRSQSGYHRRARARAAGAAIRPDPVAADDDLVEFVRHQSG